MKNIIYYLLVSLLLTSCITTQKQEDLQLISPDANEASIMNQESNDFIDGIYPATTDSTRMSYTFEHSPHTSFFIDYKPVIVPQDFKSLRIDYNIMDEPVISVELHPSAHKTWYDATLKAYKSGEPLFIIINNKVVSAPMLNSPISGGKLQISGNYTEDEIKDIINTIKMKYSSDSDTREKSSTPLN